MASADKQLQLIISIENDDVVAATKILSGEFDKKFLQPYGSLRVSAVQLAAWQGRIEFLKILIENGADINEADKIGRCPLFLAAHRGNIETVTWLLEHGACTNNKIRIDTCPRTNTRLCMTHFVGRKLPIPDCWGRTPLHQAVKHNHAEVVRLLVAAEANVNVEDYHKITPLILAGSLVTQKDPKEMSKFVDIIDILVSAGADTNTIHPDTGTTALHHAAALGSHLATKRLLHAGAQPFYQCKSTGSTPLHIAASIGSVDTLLVLLSKIPPDNIDIPDRINRTSLHRASYQGHRDCVRMLIDHGGNLAKVTDTGVTVIDAIFTHIPRPVQLLNGIFDSRVKANSNCFDENPNITVDFKVLTPKGELQMGVLTALIAGASNAEQLTILQHPVVETFLWLKWSKLRIFFFILVLIHGILVVSLSSYSMMLLQYRMDVITLRWILGGSSGAILIHNMIQVLLVPRYYLRQFETWMSFACATISLAIAVAANSPQQPSQWVLHSMGIAILLGWIQMMLLVGRFPTWGYYALVFSTVLKNIFKVLLAFVCLIVGFALSFAVLFHGNDQFRNSWRAVLKTVVMMMGEYEYSDLFKNEQNKSFFVPGTDRVVFLAFVMLASIVLTNLIIGLAVNDIQGLEKEGHMCQLLKQAEFVGHLERVTSHRIFRSNWQHPPSSLLKGSRRGIPTKITFAYHGQCFRESSVRIPAPLSEALFLTASRNSRDNGSLLVHENHINGNSELMSMMEEILSYIRMLGSNPRARKISNRISMRT